MGEPEPTTLRDVTSGPITATPVVSKHLIVLDSTEFPVLEKYVPKNDFLKSTEGMSLPHFV